MADTIIDVVDLAKTFKEFISYGSVKFDPIDLKNKIMTTDNDVFIRVTKKIGSATTILSVDDVNDDYINKAILG